MLWAKEPGLCWSGRGHSWLSWIQEPLFLLPQPMAALSLALGDVLQCRMQAGSSGAVPPSPLPRPIAGRPHAPPQQAAGGMEVGPDLPAAPRAREVALLGWLLALHPYKRGLEGGDGRGILPGSSSWLGDVVLAAQGFGHTAEHSLFFSQSRATKH